MHRLMIFIFSVEEDLRLINPSISLPYWDSTLDFDMVDPVDSIIWTETFLGNGNGFVTTGPFANWMAGANPLTRNIGEGSTLFTKEIIRRILTRCRIRDITSPTAMPQFNLETFHGGPHNWVGGQMSGLNTAAHDPVFFLHHAFVDYIWEIFRIRQARFCGVNPSTDYPPTMGLHAAGRPMDGFPQYRNVDGYRSYWTRFWYRYERSPTCSMWRPFCGSPYLRCDIRRRRCVSMARMGPSPAGGAFGAAFAAAGSPSSPASAMAARAQASTVVTGPRFVAPPPEPRTQDARMSMSGGRMRRSANQTLETNTDSPIKDKQSNTVKDLELGPVLKAPVADIKANTNQNDFFTGGIIGIEHDIAQAGQSNGSAFSVSDDTALLPIPDYHELPLTDILRPPPQNTFILNDRVDVAMWAFIPVKVLYTSNLENPVLKFLNSRRQHSSHRNEQMNSSTSDLPRTKCIQDESGAMQVRIQSIGLNYNGEYSGYALIDRHLPVDSAITYIGIKSPDIEHTEVILSAVHSCGLMCQAYCFIPGSVPSEFKPCSGALKISNQDQTVYGRTYEEAVSRVWRGVMSGGGVENESLRIAFDCSNDDKTSWHQGNGVSINTMF